MSRDEQNTLSWRMQALVVLLNLVLIFHVFGLYLMIGAMTIGGSGLDLPGGLWHWFLGTAFLLLGFVATVWLVARVNRHVSLFVGLVALCVWLELNTVGMKAVNYVSPFIRDAIETHDDLPPINGLPVVALVDLVVTVGTFWLVFRIHRMMWKHLVIAPAQQPPPIPELSANR